MMAAHRSHDIESGRQTSASPPESALSGLVHSYVAALQIDEAALAQATSYLDIVRRDFATGFHAFYDRMAEQGVKASILGPRRAELEGAVARHFELLFADIKSERYFRSFDTLIALESEIEAGARARFGAATILADLLFVEAGRRHYISARRATRACSTIFHLILCDILSAITLHHHADSRRNGARSQHVSALIASFREQGETLSLAMRRSSVALADNVSEANSALHSAASEVMQSGAAIDDARQATAATAAAVGRLANSITEIRSKAQQSSGRALEAVANASDARSAVAHLSDAAQQVGSIVGTIAKIAEQTNLLALNATIEAARAGEAGRGFAVVASEVKTLATQTAEATGQITAQISAIQDAARECATQIGTILRAVEAASAMAISIASAVDQQSKATTEITQQAQASNHSTARIAETIATIKDQIEALGGNTGKILGGARVVDRSGDAFAEDMERLIARLSTV